MIDHQEVLVPNKRYTSENVADLPGSRLACLLSLLGWSEASLQLRLRQVVGLVEEALVGN